MKLEEAIERCKVRGYIARDAKGDRKYWKNSMKFEKVLVLLAPGDQEAEDWGHYDPEGEETSIVG